MSVQVAVLWPLPAVSQVSCQLSETSDSRTGMAWPAGRAMLDGSAVSVVDRQACGSDLPVTGCQSHRRATRQHSPLSSHLTTDGGEALNPNLACRLPCFLPCCSIVHPMWLLKCADCFTCEIYWLARWQCCSLLDSPGKYWGRVVQSSGFTFWDYFPAGQT